MLTTTAIKLRSLIRRRVETAVEASWAGSKDPEDAEIAREEEQEAIDRLHEFITQLEKEDK